jgi:hypothetical protein
MKLFFLGLAFFFGSLQAQAYLLPATSVLQKAIQQRSGLKSIEWMAKVTDLKNNFVFQENLWIDFESGKVGASYLSLSHEPLGSIQTTLNSLAEFGRFWLSIGMDPSVSRTRKAMQDLKVAPAPGEDAALSRVGTRVAWMWGEGARIFFEKDDFSPLQYQRGSGNGSSNGSSNGSEVLVFHSFAVASDKARVPKSVVFRSGARDLFFFELKAIKVDLPLKDKTPPVPIEDAPLKEWVSLVR